MLLILCHSGQNSQNILYRYANKYENTSRFISDQISAYFESFRLFRPILAEMQISTNTRFWPKKRKKIIKNSYLLLLGFVLFFLFFFLISVSSSSSSFFLSSSSFGFGLLPNYLFFFICVSLAVLHLCLDFRAFRL